MQLLRKFGGDGEKSLAVLAFAFGKELDPPLVEPPELGLKAGQKFQLVAPLIVQVAQHGITQGKVILRRAGVQGGLHVGGTAYQGTDVDARYSHGQKPHIGHGSVTAAYIGGEGDKGVTLGLAQLFQRGAVGAGADDAAGGFLRRIAGSQFPTQYPEGGAGFQRLEVFGDAVDGKVLAFQLFEHAVHGIGGQGVARVDDLGAGTVGQCLDDGTGSIVGAAHADEYKGIAGLADVGRDALDVGKDLLPGPFIHVEPALAVGVALFPGLGQLQGGNAVPDGGREFGFAYQSALIADTQFQHDIHSPLVVVRVLGP